LIGFVTPFTVVTAVLISLRSIPIYLTSYILTVIHHGSRFRSAVLSNLMSFSSNA
jgi:hypothetical protein